MLRMKKRFCDAKCGKSNCSQRSFLRSRIRNNGKLPLLPAITFSSFKFGGRAFIARLFLFPPESPTEIAAVHRKAREDNRII